MPLTRISLIAGRSDRERQQLSDIVHQSLVEEFDVPAADRFQIIETLTAQQLIFDQHYLTGTRGDGFVLLQVTGGKPRSREQKQNFYRVLTARLHEALGISPDDVMVILQFTAAEDWCFSGGNMFALTPR